VLTLRQLRYLDALARHRNFGRAADECAVSQPALSMQIHDLEELLGGELIERRQGDAMLTERGQAIADRAAFILRAARDLVDFAIHSDRLLHGTLRLGIIPTLAPYILPHVLPKLQRDYPNLQLTIVEAQIKTLLTELARANIDLIVSALPLERDDVETLHLFEDRFLLAVPASDPLPEEDRVTIYDVEKRNLLLLEECHNLQVLMYSAGVRNDTNNDFFATSLTTIMQMVASGYGVTLLPEVAVDVGLRDSRVKLLRFFDPQPQRSVGLIWRRTSPRRADFYAFGQSAAEALSPRLRVNRDLIRSLGAPLPADKSRAKRRGSKLIAQNNGNAL
jgi:LysR family hydrogen peroxide-inducible transcriptional activator